MDLEIFKGITVVIVVLIFLGIAVYGVREANKKREQCKKFCETKLNGKYIEGEDGQQYCEKSGTSGKRILRKLI